MKKLLFLTLLFFVFQLSLVRAEQPIPSYHARIYHMGNFLEHNNGFERTPLIVKSTKEKRDIEIQATVATGNPKGVAIIYVYSSDMKDILGPFLVNSDETLSVPVDDREWGVFVISDNHIYVDVWTSESSAP